MHVIFIVFEVCVPFMNSNYFLFLHLVVTPFVMAHWYMNNNACFVTFVEKYLRWRVFNSDNIEADCVTCRIIDPIYGYKKDNEERGNTPYYILFALWFASICHLFMRYRQNKVNNWTDLMDI